MTSVFRNNFNNILKNSAQDGIITKAEVESIKNAAETKDEKFFVGYFERKTDNLQLKFKVKESISDTKAYTVKFFDEVPENENSIRSSITMDLTHQEIVAIPDHKQNPEGVKVPPEVYKDFPNLKALGKILKVQDYDNLLVRKNVEELAKFPESVLEKLKDKGLKFIELGNIGVTKMAENDDLHEHKPRNWKEGSTWDDVPGVYNPNDKAVAISIGSHGSESLAIHEVSHAIGDLFKLDKSDEMKEHHTRLFNKLEEYLKGGAEAGNRAGTEELFAEVVATLLNDGESKAVERFDQQVVDYIKKEVFDNQFPVKQEKNKSNVYNDMISRLDNVNSKNNKYNEMITKFDA